MTTRAKPTRQAPDGAFSNTSRRPPLIPPQALEPAGNDPAAVFADRFRAHAWNRTWRSGVSDLHHFNGTSKGLAHCRPV